MSHRQDVFAIIHKLGLTGQAGRRMIDCSQATGRRREEGIGRRDCLGSPSGDWKFLLPAIRSLKAWKSVAVDTNWSLRYN
jgi:hypothetical protein